MNERIAVRCAALNSTCCTSTFTSDPPLFYQRSCKARLKVHPEQRFPLFTSLSPKRVKVCIIAMKRRQKIYICPPWCFRCFPLPFFFSFVWLPLYFGLRGRNGSLITFEDTDVIPAKYSDAHADEFNSSSANVFGLAVSHWDAQMWSWISFVIWLEQTRRLQYPSILSLSCHPTSRPAGGSVKRDIALAGRFLSSRAGGAAAVPHRPPMQKPGR